MSRFFERTVVNPELFSYGFETLTQRLRARVWGSAGNRNPALSATSADPLIIDLDATLVASHSDKENIRVFHTAIAQLPDGFDDKTGTLAGEKILVRTDSAGASPKFLWHLHSLGVQFSPSYTLPFGKAHMIDWINNKEYWQPGLDQDGTGRHRRLGHQRHGGDRTPGLPARHELFLRAEPLHPGAQPTPLDVDGHRITVMLTNSPRWHGPFLDARHRARGRCENRIKTLKNTGLGELPFFDFAGNQAWANIGAPACNLVSWLQLTALPDGHHAKAWDMKRWRCRLFAPAGKIITRVRKHCLLLPAKAPDKDLLTCCWKQFHASASPPGKSAPT